MNRRRVFHGAAALWFAFFSVFVPFRPARAVAPVAVAMALVNGAGAVIASDVLTSVGTALLGGIAVAAIFLTPGDNPVNPTNPVIRVPLNSATPVAAMPPPSVPASATATPSTNVQDGMVGAQTPNAWCQSWATSKLPNFTCGTTWAVSYVGTTAKCDMWYGPSAPNPGGYCFQVTGSFTPGVTCPTGYSKSGQSCVLANARLVVADKRYDLSRSGSVLSDPSTAGEADVKPANISVSGSGTGQIWGNDSLGRPFVTTITPTAAGGSLVTTQLESSPGIIRTSAVTIGSDAVVSSAATTSGAGSISGAGAAGLAPVATTTAPTTPIDFPDDYARQNTTQAIKAGVDQLHRDLTDSTVVDDPVQPPSTSFEDSFFKTTFDALKGWHLPSHSSQCPTGNLSLFGQTYSIDSHCTLINGNWGALQAAMGVVWSLMALFIVLRA